MRKFYIFLALNVGGSAGWWAGESIGIWTALLGSAVGGFIAIWVLWRYREYLQ